MCTFGSFWSNLAAQLLVYPISLDLTNNSERITLCSTFLSQYQIDNYNKSLCIIRRHFISRPRMLVFLSLDHLFGALIIYVINYQENT